MHTLLHAATPAAFSLALHPPPPSRSSSPSLSAPRISAHVLAGCVQQPANNTHACIRLPRARRCVFIYHVVSAQTVAITNKYHADRARARFVFLVCASARTRVPACAPSHNHDDLRPMFARSLASARAHAKRETRACVWVAAALARFATSRAFT